MPFGFLVNYRTFPPQPNFSSPTKIGKLFDEKYDCTTFGICVENRSPPCSRMQCYDKNLPIRRLFDE